MYSILLLVLFVAPLLLETVICYNYLE